MALGPQLRQKPRPSASVFVYWVPRAMFFTRHGRPWSNPTTYYSNMIVGDRCVQYMAVRSMNESLSYHLKYRDGLVQERCNSSALVVELYLSCTKATITHWRFLLENRRDTANLRTADERHKIWRFCFHFHGITVVVRQDMLTCAHQRQKYDQDWSSAGSFAALVWKPHLLSRLHDAQSRFAAFVGAHTQCSHVHWCSSALGHHQSRSLVEARHYLALTHDEMKWRRAQ